MASGSAGVSRNSRQNRNAVGLISSLVMHTLLIGLIINQQPPQYDLLPSPAEPAPVAPAPEPTMDVKIIRMTVAPPKAKALTTPPPQEITPPLPEPTPPTPVMTPDVQPVAPKHPEIPPPVTPPTPPSPSPPAPTPPVPAPAPAPVKPTQAAKIAPAPAPAPIPTAAPPKPSPKPTTNPRPTPSPSVTPPKATPAAVAAPAKPAAAIKLAPTPLNLHKAAQPAPLGVPTLPLTLGGGASAGPAGGAAAAAAGSSAGSRLNGLMPYPNGFMPNGGGGLRGTLVGCANAEAVRLSGAERDKCNERFGVDIAGAPRIDGISTAKRATFDKAAASDAAWAKYRDGGLGPAGPSLPGSIDHGPASSVVLDHPAGDYPPK